MENYFLKYADILEYDGWDLAIEYIESVLKENETVSQYIDLYWYAYKYMKNGDYDDGICYELRKKSVEEIYQYLSLSWCQPLAKIGYKRESCEKFIKEISPVLKIEITIDILNKEIFKTTSEKHQMALTFEEIQACYEMLKGE